MVELLNSAKKTTECQGNGSIISLIQKWVWAYHYPFISVKLFFCIILFLCEMFFLLYILSFLIDNP